MPQREGYESLLTRADEVLLVRLAAFLRLAEFLDRGRTAAVDDVLVSWDDDFVCLTLIADQYPAVEIWETQSNALPLLEKAFGRRAILDTIAEAPVES